MEKGKAPGEDRISIDFFKDAGEIAVQKLLELITRQELNQTVGRMKL